MITLAAHPNGARVFRVNRKLVLNLPINLVKKTKEFFENGSSIHIARCDFFDGYIGLDFSSLGANNKLEAVLGRVLTKMLQAGSLNKYLEDKGFNTAIWLSIAEHNKLKLQTLIVY